MNKRCSHAMVSNRRNGATHARVCVSGSACFPFYQRGMKGGFRVVGRVGSPPPGPPLKRGGGSQLGFTLVELMVVIGIIVLLVSIVLPAVSAARKRAKIATTAATINAIGTGVETFRADMQIGGNYPPSGTDHPFPLPRVMSPHTNDLITTSGACLIAWALAGADLLGSPGFRDLDGNGTWWDNMGKDQIYALDSNGQPVHKRYGPYVDVSKMKFPERRSEGEFVLPLDTQPTLSSTCFLDAFGQPILYYKANPGGARWVRENLMDPETPIYDLRHNAIITGDGNNPGLDFGAGKDHFTGGYGFVQPVDYAAGTKPPLRSFGRMVWDPNVTAAPRPHRADSYILISAGPDGLYGTADDVANFPVNQ